MTPIMNAFARDQRGTSVIEMGLALPILSLMLIGMIDLSGAYAAKLKLEQAAQSTIESVQQRGYAHSTTTTPTSLGAIEDEAEVRAGAGSVATASAYLECRNGSARTTGALTDSCSPGHLASRYVSVSITKSYTPMFGYDFAGADANGTYSLTGEAALRFQ